MLPLTYLLPRNFQSFADPRAVILVNFVEKVNLPVDDLLRHSLHRVGDIAKQPLFLIVIKQLEEGPGLGEIITAFAMVVAVGIAGDLSGGSLRRDSLVLHP